MDMSDVPIIIIADPDPMVSNALRVELSRFDCAVLMAATNREAEEYAAQTVAQMILLDVSKMKLSGYAACARIRRRPGYGPRPIVLTTNWIQEKDSAAAKTAGATVLLSKPYSVTGLVQAVTPHLAADDPLRACLPMSGDASQVEWTRAKPIHPGVLGPNLVCRATARFFQLCEGAEYASHWEAASLDFDA